MTILRRLPVFHLNRYLRLPRLGLGRIGFIRGKRVPVGIYSLHFNAAINVDIHLDLFWLSTLAFDFILLTLSNRILGEDPTRTIVWSFLTSLSKVFDGFHEIVPCFIQASTSFSIAHRSCDYNVRSNMPRAIQKIIERSLPLCFNGVV